MKYEFIPGDEITVAGRVLKRIRALQNLGQAKAGEAGGYLEKEGNLSQEGPCWVYGNAQVSGDAWVYGNAQVSGDAWVFGNARVSGNAQVYGNAKVYGNAWVYGDAKVSGNAQVYGDAKVSGDAWVSGNAKINTSSDYLTVGPAHSSGRFTTAYKTDKGVGVKCGCFEGTPAEFLAAIEETHKDNPRALKQYKAFHALIVANF